MLKYLFFCHINITPKDISKWKEPWQLSNPMGFTEI